MLLKPTAFTFSMAGSTQPLPSFFPSKSIIPHMMTAVLHLQDNTKPGGVMTETTETDYLCLSR